MQDVEELVKGLFSEDEYIVKNPSLHEEESSWKIEHIMPLVDRFAGCVKGKREINVLDIGGGTGSILRAVSAHLEKIHGVKVRKYALDLSRQMLEIQKKNNPDLENTSKEDIRRTSLRDKEIDLALMIDVLEHVPGPVAALEELKRVSNFLVLKVPLEDCLALGIWNFLNRGKPRKFDRETYGHINFYNLNQLRKQVEIHSGRLLGYDLTRTLKGPEAENPDGKVSPKSRIRDLVASPLYALSPRLSSMVFGSSAFVLVECDKGSSPPA